MWQLTKVFTYMFLIYFNDNTDDIANCFITALLPNALTLEYKMIIEYRHFGSSNCRINTMEKKTSGPISYF